MLALPLPPPQPPDNTLSAADQRVRGKRASAKCSASTRPWPPLYKHGPWDTGRGIKRSVSAVGLCTQTRQLKGLMFMLCPQGGHWGWERVVEGRTCGVCVSPLSQRRNRAGDGRVRLASGKGTVPQLPFLQRPGLGMADNAVVPGRLQGTPWLCSGPQEGWRNLTWFWRWEQRKGIVPPLVLKSQPRAVAVGKSHRGQQLRWH